jgi:3-deoxy-D-arabino-heptulosonate 7-phosphate (DAHP) synthase class II
MLPWARLLFYKEVHCLPEPVISISDHVSNYWLLVGDCAELFDYCNQDMIEAKLKLLLQMSLILIWGTVTTSPSIDSY